MVKEFTELQGVVGGLYAREQGEPLEIWRAVYDHYKPVSMEDSIPSTITGQSRRAGRQAGHAARLLRDRTDSHRLDAIRSRCGAPRRASSRSWSKAGFGSSFAI